MALYVPSAPQARDFMEMRVYADDVVLLPDPFLPVWTVETGWRPEPEAELSPRISEEPESEPGELETLHTSSASSLYAGPLLRHAFLSDLEF